MKETLKKLKEQLVPIYGNSETQAIIRIIFHYLKGWNTTDMIIHSSDTLSPFIKEEINKILSRLLKHEPIQYITEEARFHGMDLYIAPGVLIPRPETDELVDIIIKDNESSSDLKILDICTGSGCIALALSRSLKFPEVRGVDISDKALEVARRNAKNLKTNIEFIKSDIFSWKPDMRFDIIVSNPPYVDQSEAKDMDQNVLLYEPHEAIFVDDNDPLKFYYRIIDIAETSLAENGKLYVEINPRHADQLKNILKEKDFHNIEIIKDSYGKNRFVSCRKSDR